MLLPSIDCTMPTIIPCSGPKIVKLYALFETQYHEIYALSSGTCLLGRIKEFPSEGRRHVIVREMHVCQFYLNGYINSYLIQQPHHPHPNISFTSGDFLINSKFFIFLKGWCYIRQKMMTGHIKHSTGLRLGVNKVGQALKRVNPQNRRERQTSTTRLLNPIPYYTEYFGHKLHLDQNEKLIRYGVTEVIAVDGYSSFLTAKAVVTLQNVIIAAKCNINGKCNKNRCKM